MRSQLFFLLKVCFMGLFSFLSGSGKVTKEFYYTAADTPRLQGFLEAKSFDSLAKVKFSDFGSKLVFSYYKDKQHASAQLFDYVPYDYVAKTPLYEFNGAEAEAIIAALSGK